MMVRCGDQECNNEFYVESKEPVWECPNCGREITNRNYPFLTAKLMQAKIDGDRADWKMMYLDLVKTARIEINARGGKVPQYLEEAEIHAERTTLTNQQWREEHDRVLEMARQVILELEGN
jgi:hypothetical protein